MLQEKRGVTVRLSIAVLKQKRMQFGKPLARGLFKAIEGFLKVADFIGGIRNAFRHPHVDFLM